MSKQFARALLANKSVLNRLAFNLGMHKETLMNLAKAAAQ